MQVEIDGIAAEVYRLAGREFNLNSPKQLGEVLFDHFPDGSRLKRAFSYEWRLWTLPELREILEEAGFDPVTVYWQGTDEETGEGDGVFEPAEEGEPDPSWIVYIVAER